MGYNQCTPYGTKLEYPPIELYSSGAFILTSNNNIALIQNYTFHQNTLVKKCDLFNSKGFIKFYKVVSIYKMHSIEFFNYIVLK